MFIPKASHFSHIAPRLSAALSSRSAAHIHKQTRPISAAALELLKEPLVLAACLPPTLYATSTAIHWIQRYSTHEVLLPPISKVQHDWNGLSDQDLKHVIQSVFSSPQTLPAFNQIIHGISTKTLSEDPSLWIGKGACGIMSIVVSVILKHMGFSPKIVGIMQTPQDMDEIVTDTWQRGQAPLHVWVELDAAGKPLWLDLTCRQFTGFPKTVTSLNVPHGLIGFKDEFLDAIAPHQQHWENETNVTSFFEPDVRKLETDLYSHTSTHQLSFLKFSFAATGQVHMGLRALLTAVNNR